MNQKTFAVILLTFVNMVGFSIIFPILPFVVKDLGGGPKEYGLLGAIYPFFAFLSAPILGSLSDIVGRKKILLISHAGTMIGWAVFGLSYFLPAHIKIGGFALPLVIIALARAIDGITAGNTAVANAYLADVTKPADRSRLFGILGAVGGISILIAPTLGSISASTSVGYFGTAFVAFAISLVTIIWMIISLQETVVERKRLNRASLIKGVNIFSRFAAIKKYPALYTMFVSRALLGLLFGIYGIVIGLIIIDRFGFTQQNFGYFMMFIGTFLIFNQYVMVKQFVKRFGDMQTLMIGHAFAIVGYILITYLYALPVYIGGYYVLNLGFSLIFPTLRSIVSKGAGEKTQGEVLGIDEAIGSATGVIGPILGGILLGWIHGYVLLVLAGIMVVSLAVIYARRHHIIPLK